MVSAAAWVALLEIVALAGLAVRNTFVVAGYPACAALAAVSVLALWLIMCRVVTCKQSVVQKKQAIPHSKLSMLSLASYVRAPHAVAQCLDPSGKFNSSSTWKPTVTGP